MGYTSVPPPPWPRVNTLKLHGNPSGSISKYCVNMTLRLWTCILDGVICGHLLSAQTLGFSLADFRVQHQSHGLIAIDSVGSQNYIYRTGLV